MTHKRILLLVFLTAIMLSGCWNYREIEQLAIVSGIAVDKFEQDQYEFTVELVDVSGGKETAPSSKILTMTGETMFDAARNSISVSGEKLYWSHSNIIIVSEEIAREGIATILDWYIRDPETRPDITIAIARTEKAKDIYLTPEREQDVLSMKISDIIKNQESFPNFPPVEMWEFINHLGTEGLSAWTPAVGLKKVNGTIVPQMDGTAVFREDKLIGYLSGDETKYALFVRDEIKGGILTEEIEHEGKKCRISLEIFSSKTAIKPVVNGMEITMDIKVDCTVSIGEVMGDINVMDEKGRNELKKIAEESLKKNMQRVIDKIQHELQSDMLGFGSSINQSKPKEWQKLKRQWDRIFPQVQVNIQCDILIENSAMTSKPIKVNK